MNQRILLPAVVIGTLFAALLTFIETRLPADDPMLAFAVHVTVLFVALGCYGFLMQKAAAVTAASHAWTSAPAATSPARGAHPDHRAARPSARASSSEARSAASPRRDRDREDRGRSSESRGNGSRGGSGGRGGERSGERRPPRERAAAPSEQPAVPTGPREQGHIKWFSGTKGYGFIIRADGSEVFVHHRALKNQTRGDLPDGQPVSFVIVDRDKGLQADQVQLEDGPDA